MASTTGAASENGPYRVMVVEDATVIRALLNRTLEQDPEIAVVTSVINGEMAVSALQRDPEVDVILLDIDMPVMDGLTALPKLLEVKPEAKVIMNSTLTRANADISLRALAMGAADYLTKPSSSEELRSAEAFSRELTEKVKALGAASRGRASAPAGAARSEGAKPAEPEAQISLRGEPAQQPSAIAIGSSTGGPQALFKVLAGLGAAPRQPIFVTQHMPPTFTTLLAEHIGQQTGLPCHEPEDGEAVVAGRIYLAPGDRHMLVEAGDGGAVIRLSDGPQENFCRPAVDPMLRSLSEVYGAGLLVAILTGMGVDGREGGRSVVDAGGTVIAQDEESSVVWGMPGAVAMAGLCSAVLPLTEIAPFIIKVAMRSAA